MGTVKPKHLSDTLKKYMAASQSPMTHLDPEIAERIASEKHEKSVDAILNEGRTLQALIGDPAWKIVSEIATEIMDTDQLLLDPEVLGEHYNLTEAWVFNSGRIHGMRSLMDRIALKIGQVAAHDKAKAREQKENAQ